MNIDVQVVSEECEVGVREMQALAQVFRDAASIAVQKNAEYGNAWQAQGWRGNVARILSKASRIKHMLWVQIPTLSRSQQFDIASDGLVLRRTSVEAEAIEDTLLDLINISAFALMNIRQDNEWGEKA